VEGAERWGTGDGERGLLEKPKRTSTSRRRVVRVRKEVHRAFSEEKDRGAPRQGGK